MRFRRFSKSNEKENLGENNPEMVFEKEENLNQDTSGMLTLEGLRRTYNSCSNCGVSWYDDHVSLDCSECGGYSMTRPCPTCNGECGNKWRRDVKASRVMKQAQWHGTCTLNPAQDTVQESTGERKSNIYCLAENVTHQGNVLNRQ